MSLYIPPPGIVGHVAKTFPDTGELYIFCTRFMGKVSGRVVAPENVDGVLARQDIACAECIAAIEATTERLAVLKGRHPGQRTDDHERSSPLISKEVHVVKNAVSRRQAIRRMKTERA